MITVLWVFGILSCVIIASGVIVIYRIRKRSVEMQKDYEHRIKYFNSSGIGVNPYRKKS